MNISANVNSMVSHSFRENTTANNIADVNTDRFIPSDTVITNEGSGVKAYNRLADDDGSQRSQTDLNKEIPDQIVTSSGYSVNATAIKTQDEMLGTLLDMNA